MRRTTALGARGERLAADYLARAGCRVVEQNVRLPQGELDLVVEEDDELVFVEVKTRAYDDPTPEEQVNPTKHHQLTKAAKFYLTRYGVPQPPARFDVIAIIWPQGREPQIRHTPNAFGATF